MLSRVFVLLVFISNVSCVNARDLPELSYADLFVRKELMLLDKDVVKSRLISYQDIWDAKGFSDQSNHSAIFRVFSKPRCNKKLCYSEAKDLVYFDSSVDPIFYKPNIGVIYEVGGDASYYTVFRGGETRNIIMLYSSFFTELAKYLRLKNHSQIFLIDLDVDEVARDSWMWIDNGEALIELSGEKKTVSFSYDYVSSKFLSFDL